MAAPWDIDRLARALAEAGPGYLLPQRLRDGVRFPVAPVPVGALELGPGVILAVSAAGDEIVSAPLVLEEGRIRRAEPGEGAYELLLGAIARGGRCGSFTGHPWGEVPHPEGERQIEADQSNDSVVVGEKVVVKLYPRSVPGVQPGLDLLMHLREVGFGEMPEPYGALTWDDPGRGSASIATASAYLPGARDGWDWYVALVEGWLDGGSADPVAPAARIGGLVARLHAALARPSSVMPEPVRAVTAEVAQGWRARALATLDEALDLTAGAEGERLRGLAARARHVLEGMRPLADGPVMRIHGDMHVGQILRWDGGLSVSDFDGNPLAPAEVRIAQDTPVRDVAAMARALDHVGRVVQRRRPERGPEIEAWIVEARDAFLSAYVEELRSMGDPFALDLGLLYPLEVAQECHEYVYAARYLPRWLYVPDLSMPALLEGEPDRWTPASS